jgi:hypothetical protein
MVQAVVQGAAAKARIRVPFRKVAASRGKVARAEPIAALYGEGKARHCGSFAQLADEMISFTTHGYMGHGSPDRRDALIWGLSELFPRIITSGGGGVKSVKPRSDLPDCYLGNAVANATTSWERYKAKVAGRGGGGGNPHRPRPRPQEGRLG